MMVVRPFKANDGKAVSYAGSIDNANFEFIEKMGNTFTIEQDGRVIAYGGVQSYWHNRGEAWINIAMNQHVNFLGIHRIAKDFLEEKLREINRIEAAVVIGFESGHRWVKLLGFEMEAPRLRKYLPNGSDCALYARVRHG